MKVLRAVVKLGSILQSEQGGGTVINAGARRDTAALGGRDRVTQHTAETARSVHRTIHVQLWDNS